MELTPERALTPLCGKKKMNFAQMELTPERALTLYMKEAIRQAKRDGTYARKGIDA